MWCITEITPEYRKRMYRILGLYAKPYDERYPVVCVDEKSKQLLEDSRPAIPMKPGSLAKYDYEYKRKGTCNIFATVLAISVLPVPVSPTSMIFDFSISISSLSGFCISLL